MKKSGVLNRHLSEVIASMGHTDTLVIGDAGLPIPDGPLCIDLAVTAGVPRLLTVVQAVLTELQVERFTIAEELVAGNPELADDVAQSMPDSVDHEHVAHEVFKERCRQARAVVRTGETTPYANVILHSGVTF